MTSGWVDVHELNQLAVDLTDAGPEVTERASQVVRKGILDVVADAQVLVPVDTAATRNSIHAAATGTDRPPMPGDLDVEAGPTTHYSPHLEYGTVNMAPHAFMGPAFDRNAPDVVRALEDVAGRVLS